MTVINCQVQTLVPLTSSVYKVILQPNAQVPFIAGQYLNLLMDEQDKRPFSIASAPHAPHLELQIGAFGEESYAMQVIDKLKSNNQIEIELPLGDAYLREDSDRPILLLAGGTGFSYIKSMFEHLAHHQSNRKIHIYWGLREPSACFELTRTQATVNTLANASFTAVVEQANASWQGRVGLVHEIVLQDMHNLADYDIYLAGRFDMVGKIREDFVQRKAQLEHMYADAFAYI
jgi:NAD(P)H-flavin reductase